MMLNILGQFMRCYVPSGSILLQTFHHNTIQVTFDELLQRIGIRMALLCNLDGSISQCTESGGRLGWIGLSNDTLHLGVARFM